LSRLETRTKEFNMYASINGKQKPYIKLKKKEKMRNESEIEIFLLIHI